MPLIYGEGRKAFRRLEQEIIQCSSDLSIPSFENEIKTPSLLLATEPRQFRPKKTVKLVNQSMNEFGLTNRGLLIAEPRLFFSRPSSQILSYFLELDASAGVYLPLVKIGAGIFVRDPDLGGGIIHFGTKATYNYKGDDIDLCINKYDLETEELSKIYILPDMPNYDHKDLIKLYIDSSEIIAHTQLSSGDREDSK